MDNHDDNRFPLVGLTQNNPNAIVQKSSPFLSLWDSPLTLSEFKILDAYLARIDSHKPDSRWVKFSKGELEELLGVSKINSADLEKRIQHLGVMIKVEDLDEKKGFRSVALFEEAVCRIDQDGRWEVELKCTPGAMKYFFNIDSLGYLRYKLQSVVHLRSRYTYLMFLYLERNRFREEWDVSLEDLRNYLGCTEETYHQFKYFNHVILKRCKKELEENTSCRFEYTPIKHGRYVREIHFALAPLTDEQILVDEQSVYEDEGSTHTLRENTKDPGMSSREFIMTACAPADTDIPEFSEKEMNEILAFLPMIPLSKIPSVGSAGAARENMPLRWYHYLAGKYAELNRVSEQHIIRNRFAYLLKMIRNDIERA